MVESQAAPVDQTAPQASAPLWQRNYFELFGIAPGFELDLGVLEAAYRQLQLQVHPDRFAARPAHERKAAMQSAAHVNTAIRVLRQPLSRAQYLCELHGVDLQAHSNTAMPPAFLMQQMQWREALEDAKHAQDHAALTQLKQQTKAAQEATELQVQAQVTTADWSGLAQTVRQWMFIEKFSAEVEDAMDQF